MAIGYELGLGIGGVPKDEAKAKVAALVSDADRGADATAEPAAEPGGREPDDGAA